MAHKKLKHVVVTVGLLLAAGAAEGQIRPAYSYPAQPKDSGGAGMQMGSSPLYFAPYLGASVGRDDNLFLTKNNKKSSTLYIVSPGFKIDARSAASVFQLSYQGQVGRYSGSTDDDYVDHTAHTQYDVAFSGRSFGRLGWDYVRSHDPRGSTDRAISGSPDKYRLSTPNATYSFGAPGAEGRVELYASDAQKRYVNNRATTVGADRDVKEFGGAFYWRVMPKTYLLAEARQTNIDYVQSSPFSGDERRYYGGVSWDATAATTGTLKVGQLRREFDSGLPSVKASSWEGIISWAPLTYSTFQFYTSRQTSESTGVGNFILSSIGGVAWNHEWSSYLLSGVDLRYEKDKYEGFDRTDTVKSLGFKVGYKVRRWLTLGGSYTHTTRTSSQSAFEYDKNLYMLTATGSL